MCNSSNIQIIINKKTDLNNLSISYIIYNKIVELKKNIFNIKNNNT